MRFRSADASSVIDSDIDTGAVRNRVLMALCAVAFGWASAGAQNAEIAGDANEQPQQAETESRPASDGPIEELTVYGEKSITVLRRELLAAEGAAFDLFNELNDDDRLDFVCKREVFLGSQFPVRRCLPRGYRESLSVVAEDGGDETVGPGIMTGTMLNQAREKMAALASENPEFRAALQKRLDAKRALEAARKAR